MQSLCAATGCEVDLARTTRSRNRAWTLDTEIGTGVLTHALMIFCLLTRKSPCEVFGTHSICAGLSPDLANRNHKFAPDPWRASSSLCAGLGFWYTQEDALEPGTLRHRAFSFPHLELFLRHINLLFRGPCHGPQCLRITISLLHRHA